MSRHPDCPWPLVFLSVLAELVPELLPPELDHNAAGRRSLARRYIAVRVAVSRWVSAAVLKTVRARAESADVWDSIQQPGRRCQRLPLSAPFAGGCDGRSHE